MLFPERTYGRHYKTSKQCDAKDNNNRSNMTQQKPPLLSCIPACRIPILTLKITRILTHHLHLYLPLQGIKWIYVVNLIGDQVLTLVYLLSLFQTKANFIKALSSQSKLNLLFFLYLHVQGVRHEWVII